MNETRTPTQENGNAHHTASEINKRNQTAQ